MQELKEALVMLLVILVFALLWNWVLPFGTTSYPILISK